jgi:hypothetical protein
LRALNNNLETLKQASGKEWPWKEKNGGASLGWSRLEIGCITRRGRSRRIP